jgi:hypothetical protein
MNEFNRPIFLRRADPSPLTLFLLCAAALVAVCAMFVVLGYLISPSSINLCK